MITAGVPSEPEPCIKYVTEEAEAIISNTDIEEEKKIATKNNVPLDCLWVIRAKEKWRVSIYDSNDIRILFTLNISNPFFFIVIHMKTV